MYLKFPVRTLWITLALFFLLFVLGSWRDTVFYDFIQWVDSYVDLHYLVSGFTVLSLLLAVREIRKKEAPSTL